MRRGIARPPRWTGDRVILVLPYDPLIGLDDQRLFPAGKERRLGIDALRIAAQSEILQRANDVVAAQTDLFHVVHDGGAQRLHPSVFPKAHQVKFDHPLADEGALHVDRRQPNRWLLHHDPGGCPETLHEKVRPRRGNFRIDLRPCGGELRVKIRLAGKRAIHDQAVGHELHVLLITLHIPSSHLYHRFTLVATPPGWGVKRTSSGSKSRPCVRHSSISSLRYCSTSFRLTK